MTRHLGQAFGLSIWTYWSTHEAMHNLVNEITAPYFEGKKKELGLPPSQKAIWQINIWLVHCSKEFHNRMKVNHQNIVMHYIPAVHWCLPSVQCQYPASLQTLLEMLLSWRCGRYYDTTQLPAGEDCGQEKVGCGTELECQLAVYCMRDWITQQQSKRYIPMYFLAEECTDIGFACVWDVSGRLWELMKAPKAEAYITARTTHFRMDWREF